MSPTGSAKPRDRRRFAISLIAVAFAAMLILGPSAERSLAAGKCKPLYELIGARGSGQNEQKLLKDTHEMGPEVFDLFEALRRLMSGSGAFSGYGVQYPAVNVLSPSGAGALLHIGFLGRYTDSVREGQRDTEARIEARHARCADTRFILAGYSQGAQAVGDALQRMPQEDRDLVAAAAFFGDPYFDPESWSARSDFDPGLYGLFGPRPEWPDQLHGALFSYCHFHDWVCNISSKHSVLGRADVFVREPGAASPSAHGTPAYQATANHGRGDADLAALSIAAALGTQFPATTYSGPLDIVFVIDSTGSMEDEIDEVKENVSTLVTQIAGINPDFRVALVDYKDTPDEESAYQSRLDLPFTTDFAAFDSQLRSLVADGGGDEPESVYSGLMTALNLDWRAGAKKLVIPLGDAPAKDPEPITGFTLDAVRAKALAVDPATIDSIQSGEDSETQASFSAIADATGGEHLQLPESDLSGLIPAIVDQVRRNATAPVASIRVPSSALAGRGVNFSASLSHGVGEPIAAYDWDFTADGVFDLTTVDPVASFTYPQPFSGSVVLRVRTASGQANLATTPISVVAGPTKRPAKPRRLHGRLKRRSLKLTWRAGRGPLPAWFTVYGLHGKQLLHIAATGGGSKGAKQRFAATIGGLRPGHAYRFWVSAGNDLGESRRVGPIARGLKLHRRHNR
jgi:hypothetical protein